MEYRPGCGVEAVRTLSSVAGAGAASRADVARVMPANDNVPGTLTPDDRPFFLVLGVVCVAIVCLVAYLVQIEPEDVAAILRR